MKSLRRLKSLAEPVAGRLSGSSRSPSPSSPPSRSPPSRRPSRQAVRAHLLRLIGLALFIFVLSRIDLGQTVTRLARARPEYLILAGLATAPLFAVRAWRLRVVLGSFGIHLPFQQTLILRVVAGAAGDATPGRLGEFSAVGQLKGAGHPVSSATLALLADRILDAVVFALVSLATLSSFGIRLAHLMGATHSTPDLMLIPAGLPAAICRGRRSGTKWRPFDGLRTSLRIAFGSEQRAASASGLMAVLVGAGALSIVSFAVLVLRAYFLALALDIPISYFDLAGVVAISTFVQLLPISILGIGSRDVSLLYLFSRLGLSAESAISLSWLALAMLILQLMLGLTVWWRFPLRLAEPTP